MPEYHVVWEIDISALSPEEAAEKALEIQRDPDSLALFFTVFERSYYSPSGRGRRTDVNLTKKEEENV